MQQRFNRLAWWAGAACIFLLAGCGGGGGGGGSTVAGTVGGSGTTGGSGTSAPSATDGSWLTLSPSPVVLTATPGMPNRFTIEGKASRTFTQSANILVLDQKGVLGRVVSVESPSSQLYDVTLETSTSLGIGTYNTDLEVRVCEDDPHTCARPFPGSPWHLPLTLDVKDAGMTQTAGGVAVRVEQTGLAVRENDAAGIQISFTAPAGGAEMSAQFWEAQSMLSPSGGIPVKPGETLHTSSMLTTGLKPGTYTANLYVVLCKGQVYGCGPEDMPGGKALVFPINIWVYPKLN